MNSSSECRPLVIVRGGARVMATAVYITRRTSVARHLADGFSSGLWLARRERRIGALWAFEYAQSMAPLVPGDVDAIIAPAPATEAAPGSWNLGRDLAARLGALLQLPVLDVLRWEAGDVGHGPRLECTQSLSGRRCCLVGDLLTASKGLEQSLRALRGHGAASPAVVVLGATESAVRRRRPSRYRSGEAGVVAAL